MQLTYARLLKWCLDPLEMHPVLQSLSIPPYPPLCSTSWCDPNQVTMAAPSIPDYMLDPDAVMKDVNAAWRFKTPPDYSKTRAVYREGMLPISEISIVRGLQANPNQVKQ